MVKKICLLSCVLLLWAHIVTGQTPDVRTSKTIVADVLARLAVKNDSDADKLFADLASTGEDGVAMLADMLEESGQNRNIPVEHALEGLVSYASAPGKEDLRRVLADIFRNRIAATGDSYTKDFLSRQLQQINKDQGGTNAAKTDPEEVRAATKRLLASLKKDKESKQRKNALAEASPYADASMYAAVIKTMAKARPEVKTDILEWLGQEAGNPQKKEILQGVEVRFDLPARQVLINQLKDPSLEVKASAARTLSSIGDKRVIPVLADLLTDADERVVAIGKSSLESFPGDIDNAVAKVMPKAKDPGKLAGLQLLATRKAEANKNTVYNMLGASSPVVKRAAAETLKEVVTDKDFVRLCGLLETGAADPELLQQAITVAISSLPVGEQASLVSSRMLQAGEDKKHLYYAVLPVTGENRLLYMRKAMETARTDEQKRTILQQVQQAGTFPAMLYAGRFLEEESLRQVAAQAVVGIALSHKEYTGKLVKELLEKASAVLNDTDAVRQREAIRKHLAEMPEEEGFVSIFNGKDLTGWKGLVGNPLTRAGMTTRQLEAAQKKADEQMRKDWKVENGYLVFDGTGYDNLCTVKQYEDIEMYIDWMLDPSGKEADAGIYLRGTPQVQIWDIARTNVGAQVGSGGLYNNQTHESKPCKVADNRIGEWNTFYIRMVGDRVTVVLNGEKVTDDVILENYWDRKLPIFPMEQLELQAHGSKVYYRDIYVKELPKKEPFRLSAQEKKEGYKVLFDGTNMHEWTGNTVDYTMEDGTISLIPSRGSGGNLYSRKEYGNFIFRFEFLLTPAANNGLGIRTPMEGDAAYVGMELQILDNEHSVYKDLEEYQYHGSVYGVIPAKRGHLKPVGEWNYQEVIANGDHIKITLNGVVILDGNIREAARNGTIDKNEHPGLFNKKGHIAFLGHGSPVKFRNIRIKELK